MFNEKQIVMQFRKNKIKALNLVEEIEYNLDLIESFEHTITDHLERLAYTESQESKENLENILEDYLDLVKRTNKLNETYEKITDLLVSLDQELQDNFEREFIICSTELPEYDISYRFYEQMIEKIEFIDEHGDEELSKRHAIKYNLEIVEKKETENDSDSVFEDIHPAEKPSFDDYNSSTISEFYYQILAQKEISILSATRRTLTWYKQQCLTGFETNMLINLVLCIKDRDIEISTSDYGLTFDLSSFFNAIETPLEYRHITVGCLNSLVDKGFLEKEPHTFDYVLNHEIFLEK
ncbi:hypothetical protein [Vibrio splendidus]|uniref:hypothetical protein n=1 Tax=Vibrio splendidus TaxID=29497 RepID=UPI003D0A1A07